MTSNLAFSETEVQLARTRIALADLIGRDVRLVREGQQFLGLCPLHAEKTPSFRVYPDHWFCYGCRAHGDGIAYIMQTRDIGFLEAVRELIGASIAGPVSAPAPATPESPRPDYWRRPWCSAGPIAGTVAEAYLAARGLRYSDPAGDVLRFARRHDRKDAEGALEHHPALLAALRDVHTGEQVGIKNIYLEPHGGDRLRDPKGKTTWGRAKGAAVMLSSFDDVTMGLVVCEGVETGIAILMSGLAPVWAADSCNTVAALPVLGGVECLTVAADADVPGQNAAIACAERWRTAGREAVIVAPPTGDWAEVA